MTGDVERDRYRPEEHRELSDAVLEAIERKKDDDLRKSEFRLYEDVNPDALNNLFRDDADANTSVRFDTDGVTVTLWGDGGVEIEVSDRDGDP